MHLEWLTWTFLTKDSPIGYVTDWYSVPSGHTFSIETGIYCILSLEPYFWYWTMVTWFPSVPGSLTGVLSVLLVTLSFTTSYSSEDWGTWIDGNSAHLNLPTICSMYLLKTLTANHQLTTHHSTLGHILGIEWPIYLSPFVWPALSVLMYLQLWYSPQ